MLNGYCNVDFVTLCFIVLEMASIVAQNKLGAINSCYMILGQIQAMNTNDIHTIILNNKPTQPIGRRI